MRGVILNPQSCLFSLAKSLSWKYIMVIIYFIQLAIFIHAWFPFVEISLLVVWVFVQSLWSLIWQLSYRITLCYFNRYQGDCVIITLISKRFCWCVINFNINMHLEFQLSQWHYLGHLLHPSKCHVCWAWNITWRWSTDSVSSKAGWYKMSTISASLSPRDFPVKLWLPTSYHCKMLLYHSVLLRISAAS